MKWIQITHKKTAREGNPIARLLRGRRVFRQRVAPSGKRYRRAAKHRKRAMAQELDG